MAITADKKYIRLALDEAEKGRGTTSPNPMVGAVIVRNNRIVSTGYHKKAGADHAEIVALKKAGQQARGATLYLTLEPCCHRGRTGPCSDQIIKSSIKRVVFSLKDPNPKVNGGGAGRLRRAGIEVTSGLLRKEAALQNEVYLKNIRTGRPFVILKLAQTLDGCIATKKGDSKWITGPKSRKLVHHLRAESDAVLVGGGTVRADNPQLTARSVKGKNPYRIILSANPDFKKSLKLFKNNSDAKTILATSGFSIDKFATKNLIRWSIKKNRQRQLALDDFLEKAGQFGISSLLVEGGSILATSFIKAGLVDKFYLFIAPKLIGDGLNSVGQLGIDKMEQALSFASIKYDLSCSPDLLMIAYPKKSGSQI